jgi:peptide/nickel transport system substrate-binding protein
MLLGLSAVACLTVSACGGSASRNDANGPVRYAANGTFTMVLNEDLGTFDPYHSNVFSVYQLAYDSLVNLQRNGSFASGLAEKWTANAYSATFNLRPDVTCSDGTPLTASQVAADLDFIGNPKNSSSQFGVNTPRVPFKVTGDDTTRTVKVVMTKEPFGFLLNTIGLAPIVCSRGLANPEMLKTASNGTGPFVLTHVDGGQTYTLKVRGDYKWGPAGATTKAPGTPATVVLKVITQETTAANLLLAGEVNMARVGGEDQERLVARGLPRFNVAGPPAGLRFNQAAGHPTADKNIRQALVQALDLDQIVKVSTGGHGSAATTLVQVEPKPCAGNTVAGQFPGHDRATAESLLDQAGWIKGADGIRRNGGKPLSVDLHYIPTWSPFDKATVEFMAQEWQAIGVRVKLSANTLVSISKVYYETGGWDLFMQLGNAYLPTAYVPYLSGAFPPKGTNLGGVNPAYEALVAKAETLTAPKACQYWNQAEQALYRHLDIMPISDRPWTYYLNGAQAQSWGYARPVPTTIRVLG